MNQHKYRLDIQGLRAVAVLLVVFNHLGMNMFSGGFVGVDVFFVISGYVISLVILKEFDAFNGFDFKRFYLKRIQRLAPALAVLIITVSWFVMFQSQWEAEQINNTIKTSYFALLWVSNFYYAFRDVDYFDTSIGEELFLHTWSLGVEEQFYLFWPVILILLLTHIASPKAKIKWISALVLMSLLLHFMLSQFGDMVSFYMMPTRMWQFGLGGLVAFYHFKGKFNQSLAQIQWLAPIGLVTIVLSAVMLTEHSRYPYWQVMPPTVGAAMVVLATNPSQLGFTAKVLSLKPMVWIGNLSYSIYLWHWPLVYLVFDYYAMSGLWAGYVLYFLLTMSLSAMSFYLVENPTRKYQFPDAVGFVKKAVFVSSLFAITLLMIQFSNNYFNGSIRKNQPVKYVAAHDKPEIYNMDCDSFYHNDDLTPCVFGNDKAENHVVLMGDSVGMQWFSTVKEKYLSMGWKLTVLTKSSCPLIEIPFYYRVVKSTYDVCDSWKEKVYQYILSINPDLIILGNASNYPFDESQWKQGLRQLFEKLRPIKSVVKFVISSPINAGCVQQENQAGHCQFVPAQSEQFKWQKEVIAEFTEVSVIDLTEYICPDGLCSDQMGDMIVFRDKTHLTDTYVRSLYQKIQPYF